MRTGIEHPAPAVAETHVSVVFFTADRAYKLLKPVTLGFLDHAPTEARLRAATRELELNRRLAPDVYLGLADVVEGGDVVDRMIVMRRMPDDRRLSRLVGTDEVDDAVRQVARVVAAFHAGLPPAGDTSMATRDAVLGNWEDNFRDMGRFVGPVLGADAVDEVIGLVRGFLHPRAGLFDARIREGMVRDGHGDLLAEDIFCLDDGPRVLDCLAFRDDLRIGDVLADVAFLAMDLERLAGGEVAARFMDWYREFSNEHHPAALEHHYVAYRAHVRAKVECLRYGQGQDSAGERARAYHDLTLARLRRARARLVLVGGGPGTGKSTVAHTLADELGWTVLSSDERRKDLAGVAHGEHAFARPHQGIYTPEWTARTYSELLRDADLLLARGDSVVLDASWSDPEHRADARELADAWDAGLVELECVLAPEVAKARIAARLAGEPDASDARPELVDDLRDTRAPWPSAHRLDTAATRTEVASEARAAVDGPGSP